jgi:hypothetical protein
LDVSGRLHFEMTEILIAGQRATLDGLFQSASRPSRKHGQRVTHWNTRGLGPSILNACRIHASELTPPCKKHVKSLHYSARNWDAPSAYCLAIKSLFFERFGLTVVSWLLLANL